MTYRFGLLPDSHVDRDYDDEGFEITRTVTYFWIGASSDAGRNFVHVEGPFSSEADAEIELQTLKFSNNPDTRPDQWREIDPTYGSDAWDNEAEFSLACFEADAYNEPRPTWF